MLKKKRILKIIIDFIITLILLTQMAFIYTGQEIHEYTGVLLFVLFIIHHLLNLNWFKTLFNARYSCYRGLLLIINLLILLSVLGLGISGIAMARYTFNEISLNISTSLARKIHMVTAYSSYILIALHLGFHWLIFLRIMDKQFKVQLKEYHLIFLLKGILYVFITYGLYALIKHDLFSYILLRKEFAYFDFNQSIYSFMFDYLAIMSFIVFCGHQLVKVIKRSGG